MEMTMKDLMDVDLSEAKGFLKEIRGEVTKKAMTQRQLIMALSKEIATLVREGAPVDAVYERLKEKYNLTLSKNTFRNYLYEGLSAAGEARPSARRKEAAPRKQEPQPVQQKVPAQPLIRADEGDGPVSEMNPSGLIRDRKI